VSDCRYVCRTSVLWRCYRSLPYRSDLSNRAVTSQWMTMCGRELHFTLTSWSFYTSACARPTSEWLVGWWRWVRFPVPRTSAAASSQTVLMTKTVRCTSSFRASTRTSWCRSTSFQLCTCLRDIVTVFVFSLSRPQVALFVLFF